MSVCKYCGERFGSADEIERLREVNERLNDWAEAAYTELEKRGLTRDEIAQLIGQK